ncbi:hypothetical protein C9374_007072 [Naegleria lovaniensis]|uniref:Kinesin-like protein n=1 Tax=Naegleria lovaniensis TaxID=51637 RepID=A0AA88H4A1_NAELO|nr:uncharacterized protein C9374_007072 [Naegleria lovaniensis]KAG2393541.1 hypothetical protein C9374_007072 [Naegleria lovaniensis]
MKPSSNTPTSSIEEALKMIEERTSQMNLEIRKHFDRSKSSSSIELNVQNDNDQQEQPTSNPTRNRGRSYLSKENQMEDISKIFNAIRAKRKTVEKTPSATASNTNHSTPVDVSEFNSPSTRKPSTPNNNFHPSSISRQATPLQNVNSTINGSHQRIDVQHVDDSLATVNNFSVNREEEDVSECTSDRSSTSACSMGSQYNVVELQAKVDALTTALTKANNNLEDFQSGLETSIQKQSELKNYYQSFLKNMSRQHAQKVEDLQERINHLEKENYGLKEQLKTFNNCAINSQAVPATCSRESILSRDAILKASKRASQVCASTKEELQSLKKFLLSEYDPFKEVSNFAQEVVSKSLTIFNDSQISEQYKHKLAELEEKQQQLSQLLLQEINSRKSLQNELIEERGNIRVCCRIRPEWSFPAENTKFVHSLFHRSCIIHEQTTDTVITINRKGRIRTFELDQVYGTSASQDLIFADLKPLIHSSFDGYNVCMMMYGETGSGKSFTMNGTSAQQGIIPRAITELFHLIDMHRCFCDVKLRLSVVEIYNNDVRDMLSPNGSTEKEAYYSSSELRYSAVQDEQHLRQLIKECVSKRSEGRTLMNANSSRSHFIVSIEIEKRLCAQTEKLQPSRDFLLKQPVETNEKTNQQNTSAQNLVTQPLSTKSVLRFVDLAGSENVEMSGVLVNSEQFAETSHVNKSLAAVQDVVVALAQKQRHIPFRNSKLTQVLRDSLEGDSKVLIMVTVSPQDKFGAETIHALSFAEKVKQIKRKKATRQTVVN